MLLATLLGSLPLSGTSSVVARSSDVSLGDLRKIVDLELPPVGTKLMLHVNFPPGRPYRLPEGSTHSLTVVVDSSGGVRVTGQDNETLMQPARARRESAGVACRDRTFTRDGPKWGRKRMPIKWRWGRGFPRNLGRKHTRRALNGAHRTWASLRSNCRHDLSTYVRFRYRGRTSRNSGRDGVNLVDFGRLGSGALGCTYTWFRNGRIFESDLRLNTRYRWTNRRRGRGFRVANVAVHELGHQLGLGHVGRNHNSLSMFSVTYPREIKKLTLGRGDLRGIAALYPRR